MREKPESPFWPDHPVPPEAFTGRAAEVERILRRGVQPALAGHPTSFFVEGDYGLGKTSLARYILDRSRRDFGVPGLHITLGGAETKEELAHGVARALAGAVEASGRTPFSDRLRAFLSRYARVVEVGLGIPGIGLTLKLDGSKVSQEAETFASPQGLYDVLAGVLEADDERSVPGLVVAFDEVNGLAREAWFSQFLKSLTDLIGAHRSRMVLIVCGTPERRREMVAAHPPVAQVFDVVPLAPLDRETTVRFYELAFGSASMRCTEQAKDMLAFWSAGYPRIMHILGDAAFWLDQDGVVDVEDAQRALDLAVEDVGHKFVDAQIMSAIRSQRYMQILSAFGTEDMLLRRVWGSPFTREDILRVVPDVAPSTLNNFLQRLKRLGAIRSEAERGSYRFAHPMIEAYIALVAGTRRAAER